MQLGVAGEQLAANEGDPLRQIRRANEIAKFGLAEARRSILSLRSSAIEESGLTTTLQRLVEHSNVAGRLRCDFRFDDIPEESLPARIQHELLRIRPGGDQQRRSPRQAYCGKRDSSLATA